MSSQVFTAVKKAVAEKGIPLSDEETFLSELTLIEEEGGDSILFTALGFQCVLLEDDSIAMIDDTDPEDVEVKHFEDEVLPALYEFLSWRIKFARKFEL